MVFNRFATYFTITCLIYICSVKTARVETRFVLTYRRIGLVVRKKRRYSVSSKIPRYILYIFRFERRFFLVIARLFIKI